MTVRSSWILIAVLLLSTGPATAPLPGWGPAGTTKTNLDLPFQARGEEEEDDEAPAVIIFYDQQYEGDGVFFCCDRSGSMRDSGKFQRLQQEVIKNISRFTERVQFGVVLFDFVPWKFPPSGKPVQASAGMKAAAVSWVMSSSPRGGTCSGSALLASLCFANQASSRRKIIIFLSDGIQSCPGEGDQEAYGERCLAEVTQRNVQRVPINSICIGPPEGVNEDWMRRLASMNQGQYARIVQ